MPPSASEIRSNRYREQGWWAGVRLESRFENFVQNGPADLAVADCSGRSLSRVELWQCAGALAEVLATRGVGDGSTVVLFLPNRIEWQVALLALLRLRAVPVSIPTKTDPVTLAYAGDLVRGQTLITSGCARGESLVDIANDARAQMTGAPGILRIDANEQHSWIREPTTAGGAGEVAQNVDHIMFTSSTTGLPKGVMHSTDTLGALNQLFAERFGLGPGTGIFMGSPLGHSVGGIHGARLALFAGAPLVLQENWAPATALELIEKYRCEFTAAATPFLKDLLDCADAGSAPVSTSLKSFLCGGAPVPPELIEQAERLFPNTFVTNLWGMTEGGLVTCVAESPKDKLVHTAGIGLPGLELRVIDAGGDVADTGSEGELVMRGPGVFTGYFGQQDLYESQITENGFFRTGDLARIDAEGYVRITGRLKDLIIRGGVNISPLPTEDALALHPKLDSVAVVGFPDERLGERICAVVVPKDDKPTLDELIHFASTKGLATRQLPEVVRYIKAMPRTAAGKIRKPDLTKLIREAGTEQMELDSGDDNA